MALFEISPRSNYHEAHGMGALTRSEAEARLTDAIRDRVAVQLRIAQRVATPEDLRVALEAEQAAVRALAEAPAFGAEEAATRAIAEAEQAPTRRRWAASPGRASYEIDLPIVGRVPRWAKIAGGIGVALAAVWGVRRFWRRRRR